jgi:DNA excision repair protein ERCC-2
MEYRTACAETPEQKQKEQSFMGLGLTSRKNLCLHPEVSNVTDLARKHLNLRFIKVSKEKKGRVVDARCRDLTSAAACEKGRKEPGSVPLCQWHEVSVSTERHHKLFFHEIS